MKKTWDASITVNAHKENFAAGTLHAIPTRNATTQPIAKQENIAGGTLHVSPERELLHDTSLPNHGINTHAFNTFKIRR
jgi:hypothetical protein